MSGCHRCLRPEWDGGGPITVERCVDSGDDMCSLVAQRNTLVAVVRSLLADRSDDKAVRRTAQILLEQIVPSGTSCVLCGRTSVVRDGATSVHFARVTDTRPCPASFRRVVGGLLLEKL